MAGSDNVPGGAGKKTHVMKAICVRRAVGALHIHYTYNRMYTMYDGHAKHLIVLRRTTYVHAGVLNAYIYIYITAYCILYVKLSSIHRATHGICYTRPVS